MAARQSVALSSKAPLRYHAESEPRKSTVLTIRPPIICRSDHTIQFFTSHVITTHHPPRPVHVHHTTRPSQILNRFNSFHLLSKQYQS
ncbi:hypothetical protein E2C01_032524 [Portunus trituberculatus]|uniref:Uncharacterized protein n=1 Tax=Portunus trituberculatus TaxID=210409 RepID=A0A5B7EZU9_PORTR|nr:hypothetical protein [Portunus trituberculatus]